MQLLNTIQQKLIQRSPFSEPNSSYCVTKVISQSIYNKSELGHVAGKLTIKLDFILLYRLLPKQGHIGIK